MKKLTRLAIVTLAFVFILLLVCYITTLHAAVIQTQHIISSDKGKPLKPRTRDAYVTLLYNSPEFVLGVRVLGQSLRESKTEMDYVVLCTRDVPEATRKVLENDGWIVRPIDKVDVTGDGIKPWHFNGHINKLHIWLLTDYRRLVWLDADVIIVKNADELFKCGEFCASYRNSDSFNSGVLVLKPSKEEYSKITQHIHKEFSDPSKRHNRGDQQILNSYYRELKNASMFSFDEKHFHTRQMRLPAGYNADIAAYYLNARWTIPEDEIVKIIHFTLGPMKPMKWWSYPLFDLNCKWYHFRENLPTRYNEPSITDLNIWMPLAGLLVALALLQFYPKINFGGTYRKLKYAKLVPWMHWIVSLVVPGENGWLASCFPALALCLSYKYAFLYVPTTMRPLEAWIAFGMWLTFFVTSFFLVYCYFLHCVGGFQGRSKPIQYVKGETLIWVTIFVLTYTLQVYIFYMYNATSAWTRLKIAMYLFGAGFVLGCIGGRRVLIIWYGSLL